MSWTDRWMDVVINGVVGVCRKGVTKANAKHEPTVFRDQLIKHLESVPPNDYEAVAAKLDALGNQVRRPLYTLTPSPPPLPARATRPSRTLEFH